MASSRDATGGKARSSKSETRNERRKTRRNLESGKTAGIRGFRFPAFRILEFVLFRDSDFELRAFFPVGLPRAFSIREMKLLFTTAPPANPR
jgi:hypothetical protein